MLKLNDIKKDYVTGDSVVHALKGVSIEFRKSEFVSILGQSGCGKTTLLNIIGGLDQYTSGDLIINEKSTKKFKDRDWDTYRNHSIGFVFQSYNLIPHQTVLANVELALTLSGVSKEERRTRAIEALQTVGLGDQIKKKPNQLSGGQMQRVAIARALVNDPDILLADEPTGALDSETSVQIMELLKTISNDKLIVMVTHNPELAKEYSTRIINLLDGQVVSDSNPYDSEAEAVSTGTPSEEGEATAEQKPVKEKKTVMSFFTALSLSLMNLLTKKGRTFLTAFAGSIGIIGIALILSVSSGVSAYIKSVEEGTMASYPLEVKESTMDVMTLLGSLMEENVIENPKENTVYSNNVLATMFDSANKGLSTNNLTALKAYIDSNKEFFKENTTDVKYIYSANLNTYRYDNKTGYYTATLDGITGLMADLGMSGILGTGSAASGAADSLMGGSAFKELVGDDDYIQSQYEKLYGNYPTKANEVVLIVDRNHQISDFTLYTLGIKNTQELKDYITAMRKGETFTIEEASYSYEELCGYKFKVIPDSEKYKVENGKIVARSQDEIQNCLDKAESLEIVGILCPTENSSSTSVIGAIGYKHELMADIIKNSNSSKTIAAQLANKEYDMTNGLPFEAQLPDLSVVRGSLAQMLDPMLQSYGTSVAKSSDVQLLQYLKMFLTTDEGFAALLTFEKDGGKAPWGGYTADDVKNVLKPFLDEFSATTSNQKLAMFCSTLYNAVTAAGGEANFALLVNALLYPDLTLTADEIHAEALKYMGYVDEATPKSILIYPKDFDAKQNIKDELERYNNSQTDENNKISYSDTVALLMSSVTTIVDAITYVLVAFVAISLIVSSIMIGIITYISVLERTKEIGILRAIGASKKDISRVFNAETLIVGFAAGVIGILVSLFFIAIINVILLSLTGLETLQAVLPVGAAVILVLISMGLTLVAGLFPAKVAAKKDPVIALRSE